MPPDRARIMNAQGRQKSCSECAKGKRKCDLGHPTCARCRKQHLTCTYPQPPRQLGIASEEASAHDLDDLDIPDLSIGLENMENVALPPLNFDVHAMQYASSTDTTCFDLGVGITSLASLSSMLYNSADEEDQLAIGRAHHRLDRTFSAAHIAPFAKSRIQWSIDQLKLAPKMMVEQNGTPWQHPMLYDEHMPRSLQDSHAACALYITRNGNNEEFVARFVKERAEELVASPLQQQPTDILARAHALMLYQCILVFGGDVRLYSQAELLLPHMEEVGKYLLSLAAQEIDPIDPLPLYPSAAARASWKAYIFRESLRRTALSLFQFVTMCYLLRGQLTSCSKHVAVGNRVILSAHLWDAKTAFEYALAWNNTKYYIVKDLDFTEVLRNAMPEDLDTFAKMMMVGLQGEDDIRGWLYTRGGTL
jgi:hypothetical protein